MVIVIPFSGMDFVNDEFSGWNMNMKHTWKLVLQDLEAAPSYLDIFYIQLCVRSSHRDSMEITYIEMRIRWQNKQISAAPKGSSWIIFTAGP